MWVPAQRKPARPPASVEQDPGRLAGLQRQKLGGRPRRDRGGGYVVELKQGLPAGDQWLQHSPAGPGDITLCTPELTRVDKKILPGHACRDVYV